MTLFGRRKRINVKCNRAGKTANCIQQYINQDKFAKASEATNVLKSRGLAGNCDVQITLCEISVVSFWSAIFWLPFVKICCPLKDDLNLQIASYIIVYIINSLKTVLLCHRLLFGKTNISGGQNNRTEVKAQALHVTLILLPSTTGTYKHC